MKYLILILTILISFSLFANECADELISKSSDYDERAEVKILDSSDEKLNKERVTIWNKYYNYGALGEHCIEIMDIVKYQGKSGKTYVEFHTNVDECDGGNVYGLVLDMNNNIVIEISDSGFYCPNNI